MRAATAGMGSNKTIYPSRPCEPLRPLRIPRIPPSSFLEIPPTTPRTSYWLCETRALPLLFSILSIPSPNSARPVGLPEREFLNHSPGILAQSFNQPFRCSRRIMCHLSPPIYFLAYIDCAPRMAIYLRNIYPPIPSLFCCTIDKYRLFLVL